MKEWNRCSIACGAGVHASEAPAPQLLLPNQDRGACAMPEPGKEPPSDPYVADLLSFVCPRCGAVSYHPIDRAKGYCARCHDYTGDPSSPGPLFRRCDDPECWYLRGADPPRVHYHYIGRDD